MTTYNISTQLILNKTLGALTNFVANQGLGIVEGRIYTPTHFTHVEDGDKLAVTLHVHNFASTTLNFNSIEIKTSFLNSPMSVLKKEMIPALYADFSVETKVNTPIAGIEDLVFEEVAPVADEEPADEVVIEEVAAVEEVVVAVEVAAVEVAAVEVAAVEVVIEEAPVEEAVVEEAVAVEAVVEEVVEEEESFMFNGLCTEKAYFDTIYIGLMEHWLPEFAKATGHNLWIEDAENKVVGIEDPQWFSDFADLIQRDFYGEWKVELIEAEPVVAVEETPVVADETPAIEETPDTTFFNDAQVAALSHCSNITDFLHGFYVATNVKAKKLDATVITVNTSDSSIAERLQAVLDVEFEGDDWTVICWEEEEANHDFRTWADENEYESATLAQAEEDQARKDFGAAKHEWVKNGGPFSEKPSGYYADEARAFYDGESNVAPF